MLKYLLIAAVALLGLLLLIGQSGKPPAGEGSTSVKDLLQLLAAVPDTPDTRSHVVINNYFAAVAALELQRPDPEFPSQVVMDYAYLLRTKGGLYKGPFITGFDENSNITLSVLKQNAGYDLRDVRQSLIAGIPPYDYQAINLDLGSGKLLKQIEASKAWPQPDQEQYRSISVLKWGEELVPNENNRLNPPVFSPTGQGARLAFSGDQVLFSLTNSGIHEMIDARTDSAPSLADVAEFKQLAEGAFVLKLYSMILSDRTQSVDSLAKLYARIHPDAEEVEQYRAALAAEPKLKAYKAFATGIGHDGNGFYMGLVLVQEDGELAAQNARLVLKRMNGEGVTTWKKQWNEHFDVKTATTTLSGASLLVKVYFADHDRFSNNWYDWFYLPDSLLLHE